MEEIYRDGTYGQSNPTWHEEDAPWKARQIRAILTDNHVSFQTLCEVGCGTGGILGELSKAYPEASFAGYDISPQALEIATPRQSPKLALHLSDPFQVPAPQYDIAMAIDVIEHVEDFMGFTRKLKRIARMKVFHIPLDLSVQSVIRMWPILRLRREVGHIHYFTKDTAIAALVDCGYTIIDWRYTASRLELPNQAFTSRLMAAPRRWLHKLNPDLAVRVLGGYSLLVLGE